MRKWIAMVALCALTTFGYAEAPVMKVLIAKDVTGAMVEVLGPYKVYDPADNSFMDIGMNSKAYFVLPTEEGIRWGEDFPGTFQFKIVPTTEKTTTLVNGVQYRGALVVYQVGTRVNIVNEVDIDDFIKSILAPQFDKPLNSEVMNSIAIAARTDAWYQACCKPDAYYQVESDAIGYNGYSVTRRPNGVDHAVDVTHHLILQYQGTPFAARWTENSAGKTAPYGIFFRKDGAGPQLGTDAPLAAKGRSNFSWSVTLSKSELTKLTGVDKIEGIEAFTDKNSGKVYGIRLKGTGTRDMDFLAFQEAIGSQRLQGSDFTVSTNGDAVTFRGYGKGAGVGLCIYSAEQMAQHGLGATQILSAFYPSAQMVHIQ